MKNPGIGIFLGAVVLFVWGALSWTVLPFHRATLKNIPEEQLVMDTLKTVIPDPGFYVFPNRITSTGVLDDAAWAEKYRKGPDGILIFSPQGQEHMGPMNFIVDFVRNLVIASIAMLLLFLASERVQAYFPRVVMVVLLGFLAWLSVDLPYWNWFKFPAGFTFVALFDHLVGYLLLGLVEAKFLS